MEGTSEEKWGVQQQNQFLHYISKLQGHASSLADNKRQFELTALIIPCNSKEEKKLVTNITFSEICCEYQKGPCVMSSIKKNESSTISANSFPYRVVFPKEALEPNNQECPRWALPQQELDPS